MEVGEQHLVGPQHRAFVELGLFHLYQEIGPVEDLGRVPGDPRAGALIVRVGESDPGTGLALDEHLMARGHQLPYPGGHHAHAVLVHLDFFGNPDSHVTLLAATASRCIRQICRTRIERNKWWMSSILRIN
jgi:hypothetical protein